MKVLGSGEQFDVVPRSMHMQIARPPSQGSEVGQPPWLGADLRGLPKFDVDLAGNLRELGAPLDREAVLARGQVHLSRSRADEVVMPKGASWRSHRVAGGIFEMDPAGRGLPLGVHD